MANASERQLEHIIAQAESVLSAQLTVGLAGDQRALVLAGFIAAAAVTLIGGAAIVLVGGRALFLGYLAIAAATGLLMSLRLAVHAARPVPFEWVGNVPAQWYDDVMSNKSIADSMREQALHYQGMIETNNATLSANAAYLERSFDVLLYTLVGAGSAFTSYFALGHLRLLLT